MIEENKVSALSNWLSAGAPPKRDFSDLIAEIGKRLVAAGIPIDQFGVYVTMLHSALPGRLTYWTEAAGTRLSLLTPQQVRAGDSWIGTPAESCMRNGRITVYTLGQSPEFDKRDDSKRMAERGYTQVVCTPLHSSYTIANSVASYSTKRDGGLREEEVHALRLIQAPLARVVEGFVLHEGTVQVLSTYVGRDAGKRVLEGNIMRGHTERIPSIVLFSDLKGFTARSNNEPAEEVIDTLNVFYGIAEKAIGKNNGEILKFMGDGLLAIFPTPDDLAAQIAASTGAVDALKDIRDGLADQGRSDIEFRSSLHLGDIYYGNIGSETRLDFTAIGPTVNLAARLLCLAGELDIDLVCSEDFHRLAPGQSTVIGEYEFKGFDKAQRVYRVDL
jgi:adenylate cyclase